MFIRIFFIIWISFSTYSHAQTHGMKQFTVQDGLPTNTIYSIAEDKDGIIWMGTDAGICRFDGQSFEVFTTNDGLPDLEILDIYKDLHGELWFTTYNGSAFKWTPEQMFFIPKGIPKSGVSKKVISNMIHTTDNYIYFITNPPGMYYLHNNQLKDLSHIFPSFSSYSFYNSTENQVVYQADNKLFKIKAGRISDIKELKQENRSSICYYSDSINVFFRNGALYENNGGHIKIIIPDSVLNIESDSLKISRMGMSIIRIDDDLWINHGAFHGCTQLSGFFNDKLEIHKWLEDDLVSHIIKDRKGNLWFSTITSGAFKTSHLIESSIGTQEELGNNDIQEICVKKNKDIITGSLEGDFRLFKFQENHYVSGQAIFEKLAPQRARGIIELKNDSYIVATDTELFIKDRVIKSITNLKNFSFDQSNNILFNNARKLYKYDINKNEIIGDIPLQGKRIIYAIESKDHSIWIGNNEGLFLKDSLMADTVYTLPHFPKKRIIKIINFNDTTVCACSNTSGLYLITRNHSKHLNTSNGLASNNCFDIEIDASNYLWYGSNQGVNKLQFNADFEIEKNSLYSQDNLLVSNGVRQVIVRDSLSYIATSKGLSIFKSNPEKYFSIPQPYIRSISSFKRTFNFPKNIVLEPEEKDLLFIFSAIDFDQKVHFDYQLEGYDDQWHSSLGREVRYSQLSPGDYIFKARARSIPSDSIQPIAACKIYITPALWQTLTFKIIVAFGLLCSIFFFLRNQWKMVRKQDIAKRKQLLSEIKALHAQMNPHFIFNALNSIQDFIFKQDELSANHYLVKFTSLIRKILDHSNVSFITLSEEIATLKLYLELEKLRFDEGFEYRIMVDPLLSTDSIQIPPMLLQPFVENAILHGLLPKQGFSLLQLHFQQSKNGLECLIEDNGVGREHHKKRKWHKSMGIQNIKDRIQIYSDIYNQEIHLEIIDQKNRDGQASGTKVILFIETEPKST